MVQNEQTKYQTCSPELGEHVYHNFKSKIFVYQYFFHQKTSKCFIFYPIDFYAEIHKEQFWLSVGMEFLKCALAHVWSCKT